MTETMARIEEQRAAFRRELAEAGVDDTVADAVAAHAEPAIRFVTEPTASLPVGASRLGGDPDLPAGFAWPEHGGRALTFLLQLDLAALTELDVAGRLPRTGYLWLFYDLERQPWGFPQERGGWAVRYADVSASDLERRASPRRSPVRVCALRFAPALTVPDDLSWRGMVAGPQAEQVEQARDGSDVLASFGHRLLGWPKPVQHDQMELQCETSLRGLTDEETVALLGDPALHVAAREWRLLVQIDSDEGAGVRWGDTGQLYVYLRERDLAARRFDDAWLLLQCM